MTFEERTTVRQAIDRARRAQIQAQGGYRAVEREARSLDRDLGLRTKPPDIGPRRPPFDLKHGQLLRAAGHTWRQIGGQFGCYPRVAQYWLDPAYRARDQERSRRYAAKSPVDSAPGAAMDHEEFPSSASTVSA